MSKLLGYDVELRIAAAALNDLKGFSFEIDSEKIDPTNMDDSKWERIISNKKDLKISANGNLDPEAGNSIVDLIAAIVAEEGLAYTIFYKTAAVGQRESISGTVLIPSATINADDSAEVTWTANMENTGTPTVVTKEA